MDSQDEVTNFVYPILDMLLEIDTLSWDECPFSIEYVDIVALSCCGLVSSPYHFTLSKFLFNIILLSIYGRK